MLFIGCVRAMHVLVPACWVPFSAQLESCCWSVLYLQACGWLAVAANPRRTPQRSSAPSR